MLPGVSSETCLRCFSLLVGDVEFRSMCSTLPFFFFFFGSKLFKSGSWVFWSLSIFCSEFALTEHARSYF